MDPSQDIRDLWTKATLSQVDGSVSLMGVCEDLQTDSSLSGSSKSDTRWNLSGDSLLEMWEGWGSEEGKVSLHKASNIFNAKHSLLKSERDMSMYRKPSSVPSVHKYTPHKPYWMEQHTMLPLPLVELMENEVLEILTKALKSYRSQIGINHVLTQQLQRQVEVLKKRRFKRLNVVAQEREL